MLSSKIIDILQLTKNEAEIIEFLQKHPESDIADIAKSTNIARMTVYLALKKLKIRTLIDYRRKGKRRYWFAVTNEDIVGSVLHAVRSLSPFGKVSLPLTDASGFAIYHGRVALYKVWQSQLDLAPKTRVYIIQPVQSLKHALEKLDWQKQTAILQENILKKPIIMDAVLSENYYPFLLNFYANDTKLQRSVLESFIGRSTDVTFVSHEYFRDTESELIILPDVAFLTDWKNEISIEIKNSIMLNFLRELYELVKGYGKKVDQNEYIRKLLATLPQ